MQTLVQPFWLDSNSTNKCIPCSSNEQKLSKAHKIKLLSIKYNLTFYKVGIKVIDMNSISVM